MNKIILWDYNGTLLDDTGICIKSINKMLSDRGLQQLTYDEYREVFSFPVKYYYESIGFDFNKEDWDKVANEFISHYNSLLPDCGIFPEAKKLLEQLKKLNKRQFILSAMEQNMLKESVVNGGIFSYFDGIVGSDNIYAESKIVNGKKLMELQGVNPEEICLLGDTEHDFEVAMELDIHCVLTASGHQSFSRLEKTGCPIIVNNLNEIIENDAPVFDLIR